jgi:hypothetical protein
MLQIYRCRHVIDTHKVATDAVISIIRQRMVLYTNVSIVHYQIIFLFFV